MTKGLFAVTFIAALAHSSGNHFFTVRRAGKILSW